MNRNSKMVEMGVGLFVLMAIASLFFMAMNVSNFKSQSMSSSYMVHAQFDQIGGLKVRSPVTMSGVTVGRVTDISLDAQTFRATVSMEIDGQYNGIPLDTSASILTSGLLGEQYIGLMPGGDMDVLQSGDYIELTQSALVLEDLIGQFLLSQGEK